MIALEIRLNGKLKTTFGEDQLGKLISIVRINGMTGDSGNDLDHLRFILEFMSQRDLSSGNQEVMKLIGALKNGGDEISFRLVETDKESEPIDSDQ